MDWHEWHRDYDDPGSDLSQRLDAVRQQLGRALVSREGRPTTLLSICSGDGRDALPVLATAQRDVAAVLVEYDEDLAERARVAAASLGLDGVRVLTGDAGEMATYAGLPPADVFMACGVFGNITDSDLEVTVDALPQLLAGDAVVIWTRGPCSADPTEYRGHPGEMVREVFAARDFEELAFVRPGAESFSVGVHRFGGAPQPRDTGSHLFTFVR